MKTGSKKQYRNQRAYVRRDVRRREEAVANMNAARRIYEDSVLLNCNHLDPLMDAQHDRATDNFVALDAARHELHHAEEAMDGSIAKFETAAQAVGIDPRFEQFTP